MYAAGKVALLAHYESLIREIIDSTVEENPPDQLYDEEWLLEWACKYVQSKTDPEEVFSEEELSSWAEVNGFVKKES